jgi:hypothetical protein
MARVPGYPDSFEMTDSDLLSYYARQETIFDSAEEELFDLSTADIQAWEASLLLDTRKYA